MRSLFAALAALASVGLVAPALAQDAEAAAPAPAAEAPAAEAPAAAAAAPVEAVKRGQLLKSSDGARLGRIDSIRNGSDGNPQWASLIVGSRFVYVPLATISLDGEAAVTSLTRAEVRALR